jgi:hypothetical protein
VQEVAQAVAAHAHLAQPFEPFQHRYPLAGQTDAGRRNGAGAGPGIDQFRHLAQEGHPLGGQPLNQVQGGGADGVESGDQHRIVGAGADSQAAVDHARALARQDRLGDEVGIDQAVQ